VGRPVEFPAYADRIVIRRDGAIVGEHRRRFSRGETIYDPWHYVAGARQEAGCAHERRTIQGLTVSGQPGEGSRLDADPGSRFSAV